jgi:hypothetical protein
MPRISREAVAGREALARRLFQEGKGADVVQKAMQEYDVGGGRKGLKMAPARLAEIETEVKGGPRVRVPDSNTVSSVPVRAPDSSRETGPVLGNSVGDSPEDREEDNELEVDSEQEEGLAETSPSDGSISVKRCRVGSAYKTSTKDGSRIELTGVYAGEEKGLACFQMEDGRVFKLWADERVYEERGAA